MFPTGKLTLNNLNRLKGAGRAVLQSDGNWTLLIRPCDRERHALGNREVAVGDNGLGEGSARERDGSCDGELHCEGDWFADARQLNDKVKSMIRLGGNKRHC